MVILNSEYYVSKAIQVHFCLLKRVSVNILSFLLVRDAQTTLTIDIKIGIELVHISECMKQR